MRVFVFIYAVLSILCAVSPLWVELLFVRSAEGDGNFETGAEPFIWFSYSLLLFFLLIVCQCVFLQVECGLPRRRKAVMAISSFSLWILTLVGMAVAARF
jgi:hypothetical protein